MVLNEKEKEWLIKAMELNLDKKQIFEKLELGKYKKDKIEEFMEYYDYRLDESQREETNEELPIIQEEEIKDKQKLSFLQKWKIRRFLGGIKRAIVKQRNYMKQLTEQQDKLTKKQEKELKEYKDMLIKGIIGDPEKNLIGFIDIFEVNGGNNQPITKKQLEESDVNDIMDLSESLIEEMSKEI